MKKLILTWLGLTDTTTTALVHAKVRETEERLRLEFETALVIVERRVDTCKNSTNDALTERDVKINSLTTQLDYTKQSIKQLETQVQALLDRPIVSNASYIYGTPSDAEVEEFSRASGLTDILGIGIDLPWPINVQVNVEDTEKPKKKQKPERKGR